MIYPPSAAQVQRVAQSVVPDNTNTLKLIGQLGNNVATGIKNKQRNALRQENAAMQEQLMGLGEPTQINTEQPVNTEVEQANASINAQEQSNVEQATAYAAEQRENLRSNEAQKSILDNPENKALLVKMYNNDQVLGTNMATVTLQIMKSTNDEAKANLLAQQQKAHQYYENLGIVISKYGREGADQFIAGAQGSDPKLDALMGGMTDDELAAFAFTQQGIFGALPKTEMMTAYQLKQSEDKDEDQAAAAQAQAFQYRKEIADNSKAAAKDRQDQANKDREFNLKQKAEARQLAKDGMAAPEIEQQQQQEKNQRAFETFDMAAQTVMSSLNDTAGGVFGYLPAWSAEAQIAEGARAVMAPVLKQIFRASGEGVFTDKDQELLMGMLPRRSDLARARDAKLNNVRAIVMSKLGIEDSEQPQNAEASVKTAINPQTGERIISRDGGKTWSKQ